MCHYLGVVKNVEKLPGGPIWEEYEDKAEVIEPNVVGNRRNWQSVIRGGTQRKWHFRKVSLAETRRLDGLRKF